MTVETTPPAPGLVIAIHVGTTRVWHRRLQARLTAAGHVVHFVEHGGSAPLGATLLLAAEARLYNARSVLFAPAPGLGTGAPASPDLTIRLDGRAAAGALVARFEGQPGDAALIGALLARRVPRVSVTRQDEAGAVTILSHGLPAVEDPTVLARAMDHVLARLIALLVQAVDRCAPGRAAAIETVPAQPVPAGSPLRFFMRTLYGKVARRVARRGSDHWHAAWRQLEGPGVAATLAWPEAAFTTFPDDGTAYYADPFPHEHGGRQFVFCEKFPYATEKGVIAVFEIDAAGAAGAPRVVLDHAAHLSYPQILVRDGVTYMLPEMGAAGRLELFRAESFPDRWVPHAVLIDDIVAGDATFITFEGRCWLFATVAGDGGSSWDQLALFHAPALEGPWQAHRGNPVLIDASCARPAGAMWVVDGVLWRVAQDCRAGYGAGLSLCRVDRLDVEGFSQTLVRPLGPPDGLGADGVHTLNRSDGMEAIDWRAPRRL